MTPSEFKAWLEGFSEAIDGRPTAAQWARIQEQVKKLSAPVNVQHVPIPNRWVYGPSGSPPGYYPPLTPLVSSLQIKAGPNHQIQN